MHADEGRRDERPVVAVFNSHYHGDHWLANHAFVEAFGADLPIHALEHTIAQIRGVEGSMWRTMMERWTNQATAGTEVVAASAGEVIRVAATTADPIAPLVVFLMESSPNSL